MSLEECVMTIYSFIDFETTGLNHEIDQIIEVAVLRTDFADYLESESFFVKLREGHTIPPLITELTGIVDDDLKDGVTVEEAKARVAELIKDTVVVAQFASFDLGFIKDIEVPKFYCTRTMSYILNPDENPSLKPTCERLGIQYDKAHRALNDVEATKELFNYYRSMLGDNGLRVFLNKMVDTDKRPLRYKPSNAKIINFRSNKGDN